VDIFLFPAFLATFINFANDLISNVLKMTAVQASIEAVSGGDGTLSAKSARATVKRPVSCWP
jgi:hypothetical protein